jgi:myo-inositol-1(or 4)-monophosphatase
MPARRAAQVPRYFFQQFFNVASRAPTREGGPARAGRLFGGDGVPGAPQGRGMEFAQILDDVSSIARQAGEIVMRHFAAPTPTETKTSRIDVVTAADREVEAYVVAELARRFPDHHIVGEERGGQGAPHEGARHHWYVDPIDGTVSFASKLPHFCTSIALTTADRQPLLGVVYDPTRRELFSAVRGGGAFLDGRPLRVSGTAELVDAVVASGFPYDKHTNPDNNLREWAAFITRVRGERRLGSAALDLCYVAAGRLDGYWEKDLKPYDTMAGLLIAREAGGRVTGYRGEPEPQLADRGRYVASNGLLHAAMLEVLREAAG